MWQCLAKAPGDGYWQRVRCLAAAAGYVSGVDDLDPHFQKLVTERIAAGSPEREDSPAYLFKRLEELEQVTRVCVKRSAAAPRIPLREAKRADHRRSVPRCSSA
jgi:hypothetical protein